MSEMTPEELAAIEDRAKAATPSAAMYHEFADTHLVAEALADIPRLCAALRSSEEARKRALADLGECEALRGEDQACIRQLALERDTATGAAAEMRQEHERVTARLDAAEKALRALVARWRQFTSHGGWGNQENAYYDLAKHAQKEWRDAEAAISPSEPKS